LGPFFPPPHSFNRFPFLVLALVFLFFLLIFFSLQSSFLASFFQKFFLPSSLKDMPSVKKIALGPQCFFIDFLFALFPSCGASLNPGSSLVHGTFPPLTTPPFLLAPSRSPIRVVWPPPPPPPVPCALYSMVFPLLNPLSFYFANEWRLSVSP